MVFNMTCRYPCYFLASLRDPRCLLHHRLHRYQTGACVDMTHVDGAVIATLAGNTLPATEKYSIKQWQDFA